MTTDDSIAAPRVKFYQNHTPAMVAGEYKIVIDAAISHAGIDKDNTAGTTRRFAVFGERFSLSDGDVRAVFPAAGSTGEYAGVLPHIIFNRNTLPWERQATTGDKTFPWLVLVLFDEGEAPDRKIVTVKQLWSPEGGAGYFPPDLPREVAQQDDEKVTVIDVPVDVLNKLLPSRPSLKLLAHTRQGVAADDSPEGEENAVVFGNRLPAQGKRSTVHLVSVEGRYKGDRLDVPAGVTTVRLVSLKSWEFFTLEHFKITTAVLGQLSGATADQVKQLSTLLDREFAGTEAGFLADVAAELGLPAVPDAYAPALVAGARFDKTFDGLLLNLNKDRLTLRLPPNGDAAEPYLSQGLLPLPHSFRNGDRSVSWYRSPFLPFRPTAPDDASAVRALRPESADELLRYDSVLGMFDVTYAAAWEIGRLLSLGSKDFAVSLFQWKRLIAQHGHKGRQLEGNEHLPVFAHSHNHELERSLWDNHLLPWLGGLVTLQSIPANYLLPSEQLLPRESIRFFYVDKNWLAAALGGAFSVGGEWDGDSQSDQTNYRFLLDELDRSDPLMGFLLRSDVVAGWPGLLIDGRPAKPGPRQEPAFMVRRKLARDVLFCLFGGEINQVVFHQKPEVMHFGLLKENEQFLKRKRDDEGRETGDPLPVDNCWQSGRAARVLAMDKLAALLGRPDNPAAFAMTMIEGVPRVVFPIAAAA